MALQRTAPGFTTNSLVTAKLKAYKDIDLSFEPKPGTLAEDGNFKGDVFKKEDVSAVVQSVQNILLTNTQEKPFEPSFGGNLRALLFDNYNSFSTNFINTLITQSLKRWEPRVRVKSIKYFAGNNLIEDGIEDFRAYVVNDVRIDIELIINNVGVTTSVNMNRFR